MEREFIFLNLFLLKMQLILVKKESTDPQKGYSTKMFNLIITNAISNRILVGVI